MKAIFSNPILVTGAGGFIGSALILKLLKESRSVIGIDSLNSYYDVNLKKSRLENINNYSFDNSSTVWKKYLMNIVRRL